MTEKRFYLDENGINDREYEFSVLGEDELVDIINELNDENQQCENEIARLQLINNKLKDKDYTNYKEKIQELHEENNELKEELRIYRQVANCHNCKYHDYDWFDDGDEFEVCRKGNDVSEGICKDWEEL